MKLKGAPRNWKWCDVCGACFSLTPWSWPGYDNRSFDYYDLRVAVRDCRDGVLQAESPDGRSNFCNPRLVLHAGGHESFSISEDGLFANDDAADNGHECAGERRRLAAHPFIGWINISGPGRGSLD